MSYKPEAMRELDALASYIETLGDYVGELELCELADVGARVKQCADALKKHADAIADALKASGEGEVKGELYRAKISQSVRVTLDVARIREEQGEAWCDARSKFSNVTSVRYGA